MVHKMKRPSSPLGSESALSIRIHYSIGVVIAGGGLGGDEGGETAAGM